MLCSGILGVIIIGYGKSYKDQNGLVMVVLYALLAYTLTLSITVRTVHIVM